MRQLCRSISDGGRNEEGEGNRCRISIHAGSDIEVCCHLCLAGAVDALDDILQRHAFGSRQFQVILVAAGIPVLVIQINGHAVTATTAIEFAIYLGDIPCSRQRCTPLRIQRGVGV